MRITLIAVLLGVSCQVSAQSLWDEPKPNGLWDGGASLLPQTKPQFSLVPSTVTETALPGVTLFSDRDQGRYGSVTDIGNGQTLTNTQGTQNTLRICQKSQEGNTICN